jgi:hypothetical protein
MSTQPQPHEITVRVFFGDGVTHDVIWNPTTERVLRECYRQDTPSGRQYSALHPQQQNALAPFVMPTRWHTTSTPNPREGHGGALTPGSAESARLLHARQLQVLPELEALTVRGCHDIRDEHGAVIGSVTRVATGWTTRGAGVRQTHATALAAARAVVVAQQIVAIAELR